MKKRFEKWYDSTENVIKELIPFMLVLLLIVIFIDLFFSSLSEQYSNYIEIADYLILTVFAIDLLFIYNDIRDIKKFVKKHWLDIIAIFPFFLFFNFIELLAHTFEQYHVLQNILHQITEAGKISKAGRTARIIRVAARLPRLAKFLAIKYNKQRDDN